MKKSALLIISILILIFCDDTKSDQNFTKPFTLHLDHNREKLYLKYENGEQRLIFDTEYSITKVVVSPKKTRAVIAIIRASIDPELGDGALHWIYIYDFIENKLIAEAGDASRSFIVITWLTESILVCNDIWGGGAGLTKLVIDKNIKYDFENILNDEHDAIDKMYELLETNDEVIFTYKSEFEDSKQAAIKRGDIEDSTSNNTANSMQLTNVFKKGQKVYIRSENGLNLREGPSTSYNKLGALPYNSEIEIIDFSGTDETHNEIKSQWLKVNYKGQIGWIFGGFVSDSLGPALNNAISKPAVSNVIMGTIGGSVTEKFSNGEYGRDIPGARIIFTDEFNKFHKEVLSGNNGYYMVNLPYGRYTVTAFHNNYKTYTTESGFFVIRGEKLQTGNIFLEPKNQIFLPRKDNGALQNDLPPTVTIKVEPKIVKIGEEFKVTVIGEDDTGLVSIWWFADTTDDHELNKAHWFACKGSKREIHTWTASAIVAGDFVLKANARDISYGKIEGEAHQASEGKGLASTVIKVVNP